MFLKLNVCFILNENNTMLNLFVNIAQERPPYYITKKAIFGVKLAYYFEIYTYNR